VKKQSIYGAHNAPEKRETSVTTDKLVKKIQRDKLHQSLKTLKTLTKYTVILVLQFLMCIRDLPSAV